MPTSNLKADWVEPIRQDLLACGLDGDIKAAPALATYLQLLARWNATYNLTAVRNVAQMRTQHLADCMAIVPALRRMTSAASTTRVLDVGSGGGLPGVVLAILHPAWHVDCVDTVGKKAAFVRQVAGQLHLANLGAIHGRVESINKAGSIDGYHLIISRAFSSLRNLVELTRPLLNAGGFWVAMKGKPPEDELNDLPDGVVVQSVQPIQVPGLNSARCIVTIKVEIL